MHNLTPEQLMHTEKIILAIVNSGVAYNKKLYLKKSKGNIVLRAVLQLSDQNIHVHVHVHIYNIHVATQHVHVHCKSL